MIVIIITTIIMIMITTIIITIIISLMYKFHFKGRHLAFSSIVMYLHLA
jgi:hypothetical protein